MITTLLFWNTAKNSKLKKTKLKNLQYVKEYYGYSNEKAKEALNILTDKQIEKIKLSLFKGGRKQR